MSRGVRAPSGETGGVGAWPAGGGGAEEVGGVQEVVEDERAVGAATARWDDVWTLLSRCGPQRGLRTPEVAAVMDRDSGGGAEPVLTEVQHRGVAVDADVRVMAAERVVDACLLPELADEGRFVHDVTEAGDGGAALALQLVEGR